MGVKAAVELPKEVCDINSMVFFCFSFFSLLFMVFLGFTGCFEGSGDCDQDSDCMGALVGSLVGGWVVGVGGSHGKIKSNQIMGAMAGI